MPYRNDMKQIWNRNQHHQCAVWYLKSVYIWSKLLGIFYSALYSLREQAIINGFRLKSTFSSSKYYIDPFLGSKLTSEVIKPRLKKRLRDDVIWVGWLFDFGLTGYLKLYVSLYRAVPQREVKETEDRIDERNHFQYNPHLLQAQPALP